jgi:PAB-dependent poly(A)-specific ribonuclease subunit 3
MLREGDFTTGQDRVGLSLNADEFIPGRLNKTSNAAASPWSQSTSSASSSSSSSSSATANRDISSTDAVIDPTVVEKMVEVHWNGSTFYAPLSQTYIGEDGLNTYTGPVDDIYLELGQQQPGLQWTNGSYTLPAPPKRTLQTLGIAESMRSHFQSLDVEALRQMAPDDVRYKELPIRYHSAYPLDNNDRTLHTGNSFGYPSSLYKAIDQTDSQMYAIRRFDNVRTTQSVVSNTISVWQSIRHPSIVTLYGVTIEKGALFFVYRYCPCAQSLKERFIDQRGPLLAESLIWRLLVQLLTAVRHVHNQGGSIRVIDATHIILTSGTNARFSCVGILDVLEFESRKSISELQKDDLAKLGRLVLSLMSRAVVTAKNSTEALAIAKQHYSIELQNAVITLVSYKCSIHQVCSMVSERIVDELDSSMTTADALHSHLQGEYENGRLLRLLLKLGAINERPDHTNNISNSLAPQWSETGDRYVLKLFRDYVFHQCDPDGLPVLDAGHMITALNKLDVGDPEEILLSSRDAKDLLVVSYLDVQRYSMMHGYIHTYIRYMHPTISPTYL